MQPNEKIASCPRGPRPSEKGWFGNYEGGPQNKIQKDLMDKVKWNVNRESPKERQKDFLDWLKVVQKETIYHVCVWGVV